MTKSEIKKIQWLINKALGKRLSVDGIMGPKTMALWNAIVTTPKPAPSGKRVLNARSERNLKGVHKDLVKVVRAAYKISPHDFVVTEGLRTLSRQKSLVKRGLSWTLNSRHLTGHAVDIAVKKHGAVTWELPDYAEVAKSFKMAAKELDIPIKWGGDWKSFPDGPHFQLTWAAYPK